MAKNDVILFIPFGTFAFEQQLATALYFAARSDLKLHFLLISRYDHKFASQLDDAQIPYTVIDQSEDEEDASASRVISNSPSSAKPGLWSLLRLPRWSQQLRFRKKKTKKLAQSLMPRCALVSQERLLDFLPILKALRELNIPIILVPAGFDAWPGAPASIREDSYLLKAGLNDSVVPHGNRVAYFAVALLNRLVRRSMPSQVYETRSGTMLFYPAAHIFLLKLLGM